MIYNISIPIDHKEKMQLNYFSVQKLKIYLTYLGSNVVKSNTCFICYCVNFMLTIISSTYYKCILRVNYICGLLQNTHLANVRVNYFLQTHVYKHSLGLVVSPVSEYVHAPGKFIAPIPPHSLRVERDVSLEMCAAKCTIYFRTRQFPCYAFEYTAGSRMCVYTNMTTLLIQDGYLGLHDNPSVDFYERSKGLHGSV